MIRSGDSAVVTGLGKLERYRDLVDDWEAFSEACRRDLPTCLWTNTLRTTPERLAEWLRRCGLKVEPLGWDSASFRLDPESKPGNSLPFIAGLCHAQEEVSLLPVHLLDPQPGDRVLDLCAAPGGKTAQIAVAMAGRGTLVANDRDFGRLNTLRRTIERLGLVNIAVTCYDAGNLPREAGRFDRVLADVPCSCEGTSRKSPEVLFRSPTKALDRLAGAQRAILRKAILRCRPGGRIVYSTCTYAPEENEAVIEDVLESLPPGSARLVPARVEGFRSEPGLAEWNGRRFDSQLLHCLRVWPHHNDTGGFFVAVLERALDDDRTIDQEKPASGSEADPQFESSFPEAVDSVQERFGMDVAGAAGGDLEVFQRNRRAVRIVARKMEPPRRPEPRALGMTFARTDILFPKLTTGAAMAFGGLATKNLLTVDRQQADAYLSRQPFAVGREQARGLEGHGYVIVRCEEVVLGVGLYRPRDEATQAGSDGADRADRADRANRDVGDVASLYPKGWMLPAGRSAFGQRIDESPAGAQKTDERGIVTKTK